MILQYEMKILVLKNDENDENDFIAPPRSPGQ